MMPIEKQVCSLELAKKLKELGVKQESLFYYDSETMRLHQGFTSHVDKNGKMVWSISAFTCAELGEMLPEEVGYYKRIDGSWRVGCDIGMLGVKNEKGNYAYNPINFEHEHEANARAKMLVYLLENGLMGKETCLE